MRGPNSIVSPSDLSPSILSAFGICGLINALFCFGRAFKKKYFTVWAYLVRPLLMMACINLIIMFSVNVASEVTPDGFSVFMIIFCSIGLLTIPFLRFDRKSSSTADVIPPPIPVPDAGFAAAVSPIPPVPASSPSPVAAESPVTDWSNPAIWGRWSRRYRSPRLRRLDRIERLQNGKTFLSMLCGLLILASVVLVFAIGVNLPLAISLNLPDAQTAQHIRINFIGDHPFWPIVAMKLLCVAATLTAILAMILSLIARSGSNFLHLLRAVIGISGLLLATLFVAEKFNGPAIWPNVANELLTDHQPDKAIDTIITAFQNPATIAGGLLFIISMVILCTPRRDRSAPITKGNFSTGFKITMLVLLMIVPGFLFLRLSADRVTYIRDQPEELRSQAQPQQRRVMAQEQAPEKANRQTVQTNPLP